MALTLISQPKLHQPAYNPLNFRLSSTNSGNTDFRYKVEVTVAGSKRAELFIQPRPDTETLFVDVHTIVEVFVKDEPEHLFTPSMDVELAGGFAVYKIDVTEFEGSSSGAVYNGTNRFANSIAQSWQDYIAEAYDDYPDANFLTYRSQVRIRKDTRYQLNFISNYLDLITPEVAKVRYQPEGGSVVDIANPNNDALDLNTFYLSVLVGFDHLSITAQSFDVWLADAADNVLGDKIKFVQDTYCPKPTDTVVYYQNRLGGWDALSFYANPTFITEVDRIRYSRTLGSETGYSATEHQIVTAAAKYEDLITLRHQWMSDEESKAMSELLTSPTCYASFDGSALVPIVVESTLYERRYRERDRLFSGEIDIKLAYDNITQRQ